MKYFQFASTGYTDRAANSNIGVDPAKGFGEEAEKVNEEWIEAYSHFTLPISRAELAQKFERLAATWEYNNALMSSAEKMILLPEYQEIIGMGQAVVPFILEELKRKPNYWFWALKAITGEDPVNPSDRGNLQKMTNAWLKWGEGEGYI